MKLWKVSERDKRPEGYNLKDEDGRLRDPSMITSLRVSGVCCIPAGVGCRQWWVLVGLCAPGTVLAAAGGTEGVAQLGVQTHCEHSDPTAVPSAAVLLGWSCRAPSFALFAAQPQLLQQQFLLCELSCPSRWIRTSLPSQM